MNEIVATQGRVRWRKIFTRDMPSGFFRNVGWQYGGTAAASVIGFLYTLLVAKALGAAQFGLIALGLGFAAIVSQFANLNLRAMVIRYTAKFQEEGDLPRVLATVKLALILDASCGLLALLLILALGPWGASHILSDPQGMLVIALSGLAFIFQNVAVDTALGLLRLFSKFKLLALTETIGASFKLGAALVVLWGFGWGVIGLLAVLLLTNLCVNLALLTMALGTLRRRVPIRPHAPLSLLATHRREMSRFVLHNYLASLCDFTGRDLDINLLGFFTSKDVVGVYKVAKSFLVAMWQVSDAAFLVVYPEIARLWARQEFAALKSFAKRLSLVMGGTAVILYGAAFFLVPWVIGWLMQSEFAEAGRLFRYMGWGVLLWSPLIWLWPLLMAAGRSDLVLRSTLAGSITLLALYVIAIQHLGGPGAALASALTHPVFMFFLWLHARRAGLLFPEAKAPAEQSAQGHLK